MNAYERVVDKLRDHGSKVREIRPGQAMAQCPAHDDGTPSLSVTAAADKVLLHCHGNCSADAILAELGLTMADLADKPPNSQNGYQARSVVIGEYVYAGADGMPLYSKQRLDPKNFRQLRRLPGGRIEWGLGDTPRVLYRLPELVTAIGDGTGVYVCEGEKDADAVINAGKPATTWTEGAWQPGARPKWRREYTAQLTGAHVRIIRDRDPAGKQTARDIADALDGHAASVEIVEPVEGKDAYDHLAAGRALADLVPVGDDEDDTIADEPRRRIRLTPLSAIKPRPVRWAWTDRVPAGELTLTPGRGGVGKSTFHAWVIAHITRGTLPGVHFGTPKPCIIAATEDSWERTIVPRLIAAGANMDLVYRVDVITETNEQISISLPRDIDALAEEISRICAALLSVDPVMSVLFDGLDTHKDRDMRQALEPLGRLADKTDCAVLGNAHFNKSTGSDPLSLIMASAAFGNVARAALGFARDNEAEDGSCVISQIKNNLGRLDLPSLRYRIDPAIVDTDEGPADVGKLVMLGESDRTVSDILRDRGDVDERSERDEAAAWLLDYLASQGGSAKAGDAIKAAADHGIAKATLGRARNRARVRSAKHGMTGGWVWTTEELTEGTEELKYQGVSPSSSSLSSSQPDPPQGSTQGSQGSGVSETGSLAPLGAPLVGDADDDLVTFDEVLFHGSDICADCGEPYSQPALLTRCKPRHQPRQDT